jgi:hypothetical protein
MRVKCSDTLPLGLAPLWVVARYYNRGGLLLPRVIQPSKYSDEFSNYSNISKRHQTLKIEKYKTIASGSPKISKLGMGV